MSVLTDLAYHMELLQFFIRNQDEWYTARDLRKLMEWNLGGVYRSFRYLESNGFIVRKQLHRKGKPFYAKLDTDAPQSQHIIALYKILENTKVQIEKERNDTKELR